MTPVRLLNLIFYSLVNFIAYIPLVYFPFRRKFRFSDRISYGLLGLMSIGFIGLTAAVDLGMPAFLIPILTLAATVFTMGIGIKDDLGKTVVTFLIEYNNATFVNVLAKNLQAWFFPEYSGQMFHWSHSIFILVGLIVIYITDGLYTMRIYQNVIDMQTTSKAWNYIWVTPMSYFIFWIGYVSFSDAYRNGTLENPFVILILILMSICSFVTYYIIIQLVYNENERMRLEYQDQMGQFQYKNMTQKIDDARKARHDLRHHFLLLSSMAQEEDLQGIRNYVDQFTESMSDENVIVYCRHYGVNALLSYYANQAREAGIGFHVQCSVPETVSISDGDLTVIFGNLVENALMACKKVVSCKPEITIQCSYTDHQLTLKMENTTDEVPKQDKQGRYLSTSHRGYGVGISSVQTVVNRYGGIMHVTSEQGRFCVTLFIAAEESEG